MKVFCIKPHHEFGVGDFEPNATYDLADDVAQKLVDWYPDKFEIVEKAIKQSPEDKSLTKKGRSKK